MPINAASAAWCSINLIQRSPSDGTSTKIRCQEYKHETKTDATTGAIQEIVTIESQDASPFELVIDIKPATYSLMNRPLIHYGFEASQLLVPEDYCSEYFMDGICVGVSRHPKTSTRFPYRVTRLNSSDRSTYRSLQFAKVNLVDPDDYQEGNQVDKICNDENVIKSLGTIRVDVFKATLIYQPKHLNTYSEPDVTTSNQMKFSERSKKACLSTTAGLTEQSIHANPPPLQMWHVIRQDSKPFLQFIFKYKPRSILESEGTITPAVIAAAVEVEKIDPEKEDDSKTKKKKKKNENIGVNENNNNKRIKTEDEDKKIVHNKKDKKPKIIDLTGSDNDDI
ncbi:hypothetical protein MJO29_001058 [Puccinia striiformis f. sp. tritici]|uniref:DUF7918 domain-containing protein n=1 Tax=Puccinia striiformis f. sp. tritici PST-78 TaxID=1165861 RepID=A0A0L0VM16_9BASI|nr:hypothetical protein MJO29_001058 [Puccinia striiformis f. sp. tritici]KNF00301.1 hypothetical protein PSTG_06474 [Puccinia striiformis f. sp. tritici PST-78]